MQNRVDYTCNYDNIGASDSDYVVKDITSFKESSNIRYKIERMSLDDGFSISGWAYIEGSSFNNIKKVTVLAVYESGKVIVFNTRKIYRPDIGSIIHKKRMYMVGFECASNEGVDKNVRFAIAVGSRFSYIGTA